MKKENIAAYMKGKSFALLVTAFLIAAITYLLVWYINAPIKNDVGLNGGITFSGVVPDGFFSWGVKSSTKNNENHAGNEDGERKTKSGNVVDHESITATVNDASKKTIEKNSPKSSDKDQPDAFSIKSCANDVGCRYETADWLSKIGSYTQGTLGVAASIASALITVFLALVAIDLAKASQKLSEGEKRRDDARYLREVKQDLNHFISGFEDAIKSARIALDTKKFANLYSAYCLSSWSWPSEAVNESAMNKWKAGATKKVLEDASSHCFYEIYIDDGDFEIVGNEYQREALSDLTMQLNGVKYDDASELRTYP